MRVHPTSDYLLCKQLNKKESEASVNGFVYTQENILQYQIADMSIKVKTNGKFKDGDVVLVNSIPTKVKVPDGAEFYLVKEENIIGILS